MSSLNKRALLAFTLLLGGGMFSAVIDSQSLFALFGISGGIVWLSISFLRCIHCNKKLFSMRSLGFSPMIKDSCPHCKKMQV